MCLDAGRVEHDAHGVADPLGVQVGAELGTHQAIGAVGASDLAPDNAVLLAVDGGLALVDVSDLLAVVKLRGLGVLHALDLNKGRVVVGISATSLEAHKSSLNVESAWMQMRI